VVGGEAISTLGYDPDVYVIILDGYARADALEAYYEFDNSDFLNALNERGFQVAERSSANYSWTHLSLASILNLRYLEPSELGSSGRGLLYERIRENALGRFFQERGYEWIHIQSTWGATLRNDRADVQIPCHKTITGNEFYGAIIAMSWLRALHSRVNAGLAECHLANFAALASSGAMDGPKFVFAHFIPPHHPYLFDRDGNVRQDATLSNQFNFQRMLWEERDLYLDQLIFMNRKVIEAIDRILVASTREPLIVIHSDHGPFISDGLSREEHIETRLANFAAFRTPGGTSFVPEDVSAVNYWRYILNRYFGAGLAILPDKHFHSVPATMNVLEEVILRTNP
jgi:hypothetical protein